MPPSNKFLELIAASGITNRYAHGTAMRFGFKTDFKYVIKGARLILLA